MLPLIGISVVRGLNGRNKPSEYNLTPCLATTEYDRSSEVQTTAMKQTATCDPTSLLCIHCNSADDGQRSTHNSDPQFDGFRNFSFMLPSEMIEIRKAKFEIKFNTCNSLRYYFGL